MTNNDSEAFNAVIAPAVVLTAGAAWVFGFVCSTQGVSGSKLILAVVLYSLLHPLVGGLLSLGFALLCHGVNCVLDLKESDRWGEWSRPAWIIFGAAWPITASIGIPIAAVAIIYGFLYSRIFSS